jgi:hypothetical protein
MMKKSDYQCEREKKPTPDGKTTGRTATRERTVTRAKLTSELQRDQAKKPHLSNVQE